MDSCENCVNSIAPPIRPNAPFTIDCSKGLMEDFGELWVKARTSYLFYEFAARRCFDVCHKGN